MSNLSSVSVRRIGSLAIVVLTLWLGGFGCALCCSTGVTELCCTDNQTSCSNQDLCCKQASKQCAESLADSISKPGGESCPLLPSQTASFVTQSSSTSLFAAVIPTHQFVPKLELDAQMPLNISSMLPANRGSTYLRCCVLLI